MRLRASILAAAVLCAAAVALPAAGSAASGEASFALKPVRYDPALTATKSYFILAVRPGDVIRDEVRIVNTGGQAGTAFLYPVDATTGQTSGAVYLSHGAPRRDAGAWITLARPRVTLAPGANAIVPFTIRVPATATPGDHLGGIVAENASVQQSTGRGALQIRIRHLTIDAVQLQLPGRVVAAVAVAGARPGGEHGYQYVYLRLRNSGTIMVKPVGSLVVRRGDGTLVARRSLTLDTFLPGTAIDYPVLLPHLALKPGRYTATVVLHSSRSRVLGYRTGAPPPFGVERTFAFGVSPREQTTVYSGAAAAAPQKAAPSAGSSGSAALLWIVIALASVLGALVVSAALRLVLGRRRRARGGGGVGAQAGNAIRR